MSEHMSAAEKLQKKHDVFARMNDLKKTRTLPQFLLRDIQNARSTEPAVQSHSCPPSPHSLNVQPLVSNEEVSADAPVEVATSPVNCSDDSNPPSGGTSLFQRGAIGASASKLSKLLGSDDNAVARYQRIISGRPMVFSPNNSHHRATQNPDDATEESEDISSPLPLSSTLAVPDISQMNLSADPSPNQSPAPRRAPMFGTASLNRKEAKLTQLLGKGIVSQGVLQRVKQPNTSDTSPQSFPSDTVSVVACDGGECLVQAVPKGPPPVFRAAYSAQRSPRSRGRSASPAADRSKVNNLLGEDVL